jgi:hypothetical protein
MRTTRMTTLRLAVMTAVLTTLACGGGPTAETPKKDGAPTATKTEPGPPVSPTPAGAAKIDPANDADPVDDPLAGIDKRVQRAAMLAKKIEAEPEQAGDILDAAGLARDDFEDLIFEISTDPGLAKQYEAAIVAQTS